METTYNEAYLLLTGEDIRQKRFPISYTGELNISDIKLTEEGTKKLSKSLDTLELDKSKLYLHLTVQIDKAEILEQLSKAEMDSQVNTILDYLSNIPVSQREKVLEKLNSLSKVDN